MIARRLLPLLVALGFLLYVAPAHGQEGTTAPWPGSFGVEGLSTRFAIGGFAQLDVIHDTDAIEAQCQFITSTIVTRNPSKADGADGRTTFCVNTSRLWFETRTPTSIGRLRTYISIDFFGDALSASPEPRLYEAYGELSGVLFGGDLLAGQTFPLGRMIPADRDHFASRISSWFQPVFMLYVPLECQRSGRRDS